VTGADSPARNPRGPGLVVLAAGMIVDPNITKGWGVYTRKSYFSNVLVDNVTASDTTMWGGIFVWGVQIDQDTRWRNDSQNQAVQSRNITIQNSIVHNTYCDGIAIYMSHEGTIQNNVV